MKKLITLILEFTIIFSLVACGGSGRTEEPQDETRSNSSAPAPTTTPIHTQTPTVNIATTIPSSVVGEPSKPQTPLLEHIYTADPSAHVFNGKLYIYPSHDIETDVADGFDGDHYQMRDYHVLSMDYIGAPVVDHGVALSVDDVPWASKQMWAPDVAFKNGTYYLYFPAKDKDGVFRIGAATSKNPEGPFTAEPNYIPGSYSIDPAVFVDEDGKAYMYVGGLWGGQLEKWQSGGAFNPDAGAPSGDEPALGPLFAEMTDDMLSFKKPLEEIKILKKNGKPINADDNERWFFEAAWMHKYNGKYYLSYSTGPTHYICYAEGDNPAGPFTYKGKILEPVIGWTTHHSIVEVEGKWYLFYHDASLSGVDYLRCIKYVELEISDDGTIKTVDPY